MQKIKSVEVTFSICRRDGIIRINVRSPWNEMIKTSQISKPVEHKIYHTNIIEILYNHNKLSREKLKWL